MNHPRPPYRDADYYDVFTDDLATGEPYDTDYLPPYGQGVHRFLAHLPSTPGRILPGSSSHAGRVAATTGAVRIPPPADGAHHPFEDPFADVSARADRPGRP